MNRIFVFVAERDTGSLLVREILAIDSVIHPTKGMRDEKPRYLWVVSMAIYFDPPLANKIDPPFIV